MAVFDLYAPFVQDYIYRRNWQNLRAIQVAAAEAIFHTEENVLLTASTASGKTEAAFFTRWKGSRFRREIRGAKILVGGVEAIIKPETVRWLGMILDRQLSLRGHYTTCLQKA